MLRSTINERRLGDSAGVPDEAKVDVREDILAAPRGVELAPATAPRHNLTGDPYFTDGLRAFAILSKTRTPPLSYPGSRHLPQSRHRPEGDCWQICLAPVSVLRIEKDKHTRGKNRWQEKPHH